MAYYFTREEAEALLPEITVVLLDIRERRQALLELETEMEALQIKARGNGHHLHERITALHETRAQHIQALQKLAKQLRVFGCELKDPDMGLIDFLSMRDGRPVYLCWHLGEERIAFWHDLDTGFAGRQPL